MLSLIHISAENGGFIVGGSNYGQGSSREHAALVPLYLGCLLYTSTGAAMPPVHPKPPGDPGMLLSPVEYKP